MIRVSAEPVPEYVSAPELTPEPETVPVNPIAQGFSGFKDVFEPISKEIAQSAGYMEYSLSLDMHYQRLQHFFLDMAKLDYSGDGLWEGVLIGAIGGSGSIYDEGGGYSFNCTLWDGTRMEGSISGDTLSAVWQYSLTEEIAQESYTLDDGELIELAPETRTTWHDFRSAKISAKDGGYCVYMDWDGETSLMLLEGGALYFVDNPPDGYAGADLASWSFKDGIITRHEQEAIEDETIQEVVT